MGKLIILLVILLIVVGLLVISTNKYNMSTKDGRAAFAKTYFGWIGKVAKNTYSVVTYAVKMDWMPK